MKKRGKSKARSSAPGNTAGTDKDAKVQGEGDYAADRRYRERTGRFLQSADVEELAREAAPNSDAEAREMADAEAQGRAHAHLPPKRAPRSRTTRRER